MQSVLCRSGCGQRLSPHVDTVYDEIWMVLLLSFEKAPVYCTCIQLAALCGTPRTHGVDVADEGDSMAGVRMG